MEHQVIINLDDYRCDCGRLLFKGELLKCKIEIKCKKCGTIKTIVCGHDISIKK